MPKSITVKNSPEFRTPADVLNSLGLHKPDGTEYKGWGGRSTRKISAGREICFVSLNRPDAEGFGWENDLSADGNTFVETESRRGMGDPAAKGWARIAATATPYHRIFFGKEGSTWSFLGEFEISEANLKGHPWTLVWKRVADTLDLPLE